MKYKIFAKTISWRIIAFSLSVGIIYLFTGSISISMWSCVCANVASTIVYYIHERVWENVKKENWESRALHPTTNAGVSFTDQNDILASDVVNNKTLKSFL